MSYISAPLTAPGPILVKPHIQGAAEVESEPRQSDSKVMFLTTLYYLTKPGPFQPHPSEFLILQHAVPFPCCPLKLKVHTPVSGHQN